MKVIYTPFVTLTMSCFLLLSLPISGSPSAGQVTGENNESGGNNDNGDDDSDDPNADDPNDPNVAVINGNTAGISIDAHGVVRLRLERDVKSLARQRLAAAFALRNHDAFRPSKFRKVSLTRLQRAATRQLENGQDLPDEMLYLAGLTRVQHVFLYPENGEVVVAGPAAGWVEADDGNVLGLEAHQPVVRLEDLIVALRTFGPDQDRDTVISCSIDPTQEGLARMQAYLNSVSGRTPSARDIVKWLKKTLGLHLVSIRGIPATTRFAQIMVAADYRMKLIGIGFERPPVKIDSYVSLSRPSSRNNSMARWYFTPIYQRVRVDEDTLAMQLVGQGVQLVSQAEFVARCISLGPPSQSVPAEKNRPRQQSATCFA